MHILVTGGAGFIGSHVVDAYIRLGHNVTVLDNMSTGREHNVHPDARLIRLDIRDGDAVARAFDTIHVDVLNHHAAQVDVRKSVTDPAYDASVNIIGFLHLLQNCVRTGVRKVIFASSGGAIYGEQERFPADESHGTRPISAYGVAKLSSEHYLHYYAVVYGLEYVALRYANVYGPRQNPLGEAGVIAIFADRMLKHERAVINGDGKQTRDYVFVDDVVRANTLALGHAGAAVFNVGTGIETDVNTIFRKLRAATGAPAPEVHGEAQRGEQLRSVLDSTAIRRTLGWAPAVLLEEGLQRTVDYVRSELERDAPPGS